MGYRFRCQHCSFVVWSASKDPLVDAVGSHVLDHHRQRVTKQDFRLRWDCPYCESTGQYHGRGDGIEKLKRHLLDHVTSLIQSGVHVTDDIGGTGNVLVRSPRGSAASDNARVHVLSSGDIVMFVTTAPDERLRLLHDELREWPAQTAIVTTRSDVLENVSGIDSSEMPLELVQLDGRLGLSGLGETLSRVIEECEAAAGKIAVEFDILSELIEKFDLRTVFKFLHALGRRVKRADALAHYHVDSRARSESTINILDKSFDLSIRVRGQRFVSESPPGTG
jgi:hypothetical protein